MLYLVGDRNPTSRPRDPRHLGEHGGGVGGVVQHHVGDGCVHGMIGKGQVCDIAFGELDVVDAEAVHVGAGNFQH